MRAFTALALLAGVAAPAYGHGGYHELLADLDQDLNARPTDGLLLKRRAALHVEHEDWKSALVDLERAERQGIDPADLDLLRGHALLLAGIPEQAEGVLARYLAGHPEHSAAHAVHARSLFALGHHSSAVQSYRTALSLTTEPSEDLIQEAASAFATHGALPEAVGLLRRACALPGCTPALITQLLEYELMAGNFDAALTQVALLEKASPRPEPWMARRARILAQAGRKLDAQASWAHLRAHLETLPELERGSPLLADLLAEASRELGSAVPRPVLAPPAPAASPIPASLNLIQHPSSLKKP